jgi:hypothetical protein
VRGNSRRLDRAIGSARAASLGILLALAAEPAAACRLALLLALDASSSVDRREYVAQQTGLAAALIAPEVEAAFLSSPMPVALAAYEWSGQWNQRVLLDWRLIRSGEDLLAAAEELGRATRGATGFPTAIGAALGYGAGMLREAPACERQTIDVSGDGKNNHGYPPPLAYKHFPLNGVTVNALAIGGAADLADLIAYFRAEVIQGPGAFVERARDHDDFERAMRRKLEREVGRALTGLER